MEKFRSLESLIGAKPIDVLSEILYLNQNIEQVNFWHYTYVPLKFDEAGKNDYWLNRDAILKGGKIDEIISSLSETEQLALGSQVILNNGEHGHIPQMDFNLSKNPENTLKIKERLKYMKSSGGWILETGSSYHFWGNKVLSNTEWIDFMGRCLLTSIVHTRQDIEQVADTRFIGHALRRGCTTLRLTTRSDKTFVPSVVDYVE